MSDIKISKKQLSKIISEKSGENLQVININKLPGGYESESFLLETDKGKKFFLKRVKQSSHNKFRMAQNAHWFLISDSMMNRSNASKNGLGVIVLDKRGISVLPSFEEDSEVFHLQEFEELSKENYWQTLNIKKSNELSEKDLEDVREIAKLLWKIHSGEIKIEGVAKNNLYNEGLASVFTSQDLYFFFLHTFDKKHPFFPPSRHGEYTAKMLELFHEFKDRGERLKQLHGDFWGANLYKKDNSWYAIDYSRIPFGDPGIDVAAWMAKYLWLFHKTESDVYKKLGEEFINTYEALSGDKEIRKYCALPLGLFGLIWISPYFYPDRIGPKAESFFETLNKILKNKKFAWD